MKSILIIDDDEDMGDALLTFLNEEGYQVRLASSGRQGLTLAQEHAPELILLDWQMPKMGGSQVLVELALQAGLKDIPVILMSANIADIPSDSLKSRRHLSKPFDVETLIGSVAHALQSGTS
jgi:CheY-like chemotaxis protein